MAKQDTNADWKEGYPQGICESLAFFDLVPEREALPVAFNSFPIWAPDLPAEVSRFFRMVTTPGKIFRLTE